jgi:hypothetical protein
VRIITAEILGKTAWVQLGGHYVTGTAIVSHPCQFTVATTHKQVCKLFEGNCRSEDKVTREAAESAFLKSYEAPYRKEFGIGGA